MRSKLFQQITHPKQASSRKITVVGIEAVGMLRACSLLNQVMQKIVRGLHVNVIECTSFIFCQLDVQYTLSL